jgi:hypothetical protein
MTLKWLALYLMGGGLVGVGAAYALDVKLSFENGWFLLDMILGCGGILAFAIGLILISRSD